MDNFAWAVLLKPLVALLFFFAVYVVSRLVAPLIPGGGVKRLLYDKALQRRHPWKFGLGLLVASWGVMGLVALFVYW